MPRVAAHSRGHLGGSGRGKRAHVEAGHPWDAQLDLCFRQAVRAARRNLCPSQHAEALPLADMARAQGTAALCPGGPRYPGRACLLASWWFLREVEASNAQTSHFEFDGAQRVVSLRLPNSKTDPQALGTERSHSCCCLTAGPAICPYHLALAHVTDVQANGGGNAKWLFPTDAGTQPTKRGWAGTFQGIAALMGHELSTSAGAVRYSGHSARASGAQHLAANGIELWRIQLFGRWSSTAFLKYVRNAPLSALKDLANEASSHPQRRLDPPGEHPPCRTPFVVHTTPTCLGLLPARANLRTQHFPKRQVPRDPRPRRPPSAQAMAL